MDYTQDINSKYYKNKKCEYYPCHDINSARGKLVDKDNISFSCLFCFCPLYFFDCDGKYTLNNEGLKDCTDCLLPHCNYDYVIHKLKIISKGVLYEGSN